MTNTNHAFFDAMKNDARILGDNFRTAAKRKRALAVSLISAAHVEGFALEELFTEAKREMKYSAMDKADQKGVKVFFSTLRTISGNWSGLTDEQRKSFLAGELIYSTLATAIAEAEKAAEKAEADAAKVEADAQEASEHADADCEPAPAPLPSDMSAKIAEVANWLNNASAFTETEMAELKFLFEVADAFRADVADAAVAA